MAQAFASKELDDLVLLDKIEQDAVCAVIKQRFLGGEMYTWAGPTLLSTNPYKVLSRNGHGLYDEHFILAYRGTSYFEVPPHIYSVANAAFEGMLRTRQPQSLIISGESGAGKTEAAKQCLQFLSHVSQEATKSSVKHRDSAAETVRNRLLVSTVLMEGFGNAKTTRNDNSSRFGKLMSIEFGGAGRVESGAVDIFLLEKNRVIRQAEGERSFHILHYLHAGASADLRRSIKLQEKSVPHAYLPQGAALGSDAANFSAIQQCAAAMGIPASDTTDIWKALAVILHLGDVEITSAEQDAGSADARSQLNAQAASVVEDGRSGAAVKALCELLGVSDEEVKAALTHRSITVGGKDTATLLTSAQARVARDALAKSIYEHVFLHVVSIVNSAMKPAAPADSATAESTAAAGVPESNSVMLKILDTYGFEVLQHNGFPQLCINFINERLQQLFIEAVLAAEQHEYEDEGIAWTPIEYFNNKVVCELLEGGKGKFGVFPLLDDASAMGEMPDEGHRLLATFNTRLVKHDHYEAPKIDDGTFVIRHYAGDVSYHVEELVAENRDVLSKDVIQLMHASKSSPLLQKLFESHGRQHSEAAENSSKRPPTAGLQFRTSVQQLMQVLSGCEPHYVRCIKPNEFKKPLTVDDDCFLSQIEYLGIVESARVKRAGFAHRAVFSEFMLRYRVISSTTWPPSAASSEFAQEADQVRAFLLAIHANPKPKGGAATITNHGGLGAEGGGKGLIGDNAGPGAYKLKDGEHFQIGKSKVFIKEPSTLFTLEYMRMQALTRMVSRVEALWRAHAGKRNYKKIVQAWARMRAIGRGHVVRAHFKRQRVAAVRIQAVARGYTVRSLPDVESMRQAIGLLRVFGGKVRRRLSALWAVPPQMDWMGALSTPSAFGSLFAKLAALGETASGIRYTDYVVKLRQSYEAVRRALVVTERYVLCFNADRSGALGRMTRCITIAKLDSISVSPFTDSYVVLHEKGRHAYVCVCETKVCLIKVLQERFSTLHKGTVELPITIGTSAQYKAYPRDTEGKLRTITFQQRSAAVAGAADADQQAKAPWQTKLGGLEGGLGGRPAPELGAVTGGPVATAHARAERWTATHTVGPDGKTLVVCVPSHPPIQLTELLSAGEMEQLKKLKVVRAAVAAGRAT